MNKKLFNTILTVGTLITGVAMATPALANDNYCRDFNQKIKINGHFETAYGRACLQPNGSWKIVSKNKKHRSDDDDYQTSHYTFKKTYTHSSPFLVDFHWGDSHHYKGHGAHHKKRHRRNKPFYFYKNHHKNGHGHKKHQCKHH